MACIAAIYMLPSGVHHAPVWAKGLIRSYRLSQVHRTLSASASQDHLHTYHVTAKTSPNNKSGADVQTSTGHALKTDVPRSMGGKDSAPQPVETLLAALAGCTQATALFVSRQMKPRVKIDHLEMDLRAERDTQGALALPIDQDPAVPAGLKGVEGRIVVHSTENISREQLALLQHQTEKRCPVASMLAASGCDMTAVEWMDGSDSSSKL